jgi:hypothetical protein
MVQHIKVRWRPFCPASRLVGETSRRGAQPEPDTTSTERGPLGRAHYFSS